MTHSIRQSTESTFKDTGSPGSGDGTDSSPNRVLRPLLSFLRRPEFLASPPGRLTLWHWVGWLGLLLLLAFLSGLFNEILVHALGWPASERSAFLHFLTHPSWEAVALLLAAPALEELAFRAFLSTSPKFIFTGLAFFLVYVYGFIYANVTGLPATLSPAEAFTRYVHGFWVLLPAAAISLLLYRYRREAVLAFFRHRAPWVFWVSCILFGAGHDLLYANHVGWRGFALVMPQFLVGVGLAYLRVSFGLRWSIVSHYAFDILAVLTAWLYLSASPAGVLHGMFATLSAVRLLIMAYGLVVLWRVVRLRW